MSHGLELPLVSNRMACVDAFHRDVARMRFVSEARAEALARLGIHTTGDLLLHIPRRYLDFSHACTIEQAPLDQVATIVATVDRVTERRPRPRMVVTQVFLVDDTGVLKVAFFKQAWLSKQLKPGDRLAVQGKVEFAYGFKQMSSPHFEKLEADDVAGTILPVHPATEGLSAAWMRRLVSTALADVGNFPDPLPAHLRVRRGLMSLSRALRTIQFPHALLEVLPARQRLAYDELLYLQLALRLRNDDNLLDVLPYVQVPGARTQALRKSLPFALTDEQEAAVADILGDMANGSHVMNRLLLGDVGTGKTAVASVAVAACVDSGNQACIMAPTSVLAQQYATGTGPLFEAAGLSWALLTGATAPDVRADMLQRLAAGKLDVLIGTHAVLNTGVQFARLALVVIDEQHRFGVKQRATLRAKGPGADLLVMTATPIPRTLALSVYGDLDVSIIRHRPVPGAGVATQVLDTENKDIAYGAIRAALEAGHQAYVICPLVSESDDASALEDVPALPRDDAGNVVLETQLHAVETEVEDLRHLLLDVRIEALHGRMPEADKLATIEAFRAGEIQVLVSTTVVEVGVDVPGATVMLIENGERFGLATLHQLRGRVGRGETSGKCFVMSSLKEKTGRRSPAFERLRALECTSDGFELAQMDLKLRHEGEILGLRQSGGVTLKFVDMDTDFAIIEAAHTDARELLQRSPKLDGALELPLRHRLLDFYGYLFKEVSGG